ncbi:MAG: Fe-S cluster assembly protein IscX [Alphaproteobacteria bacterium]
MKLKWENYGAIADALEEKYPEEDLIHIKQERIIELVSSLEDFEDETVPRDRELVKAVHYAWINLEE